MSVPAYADYRESGVPWLSAVPSHWERKPLFALVRELDESNTGMQEDNLLSLSYGQIKRKNIEDNDGLLPASFETYQIVERNDIIWRLTDLQNDQRSLRTGMVRERGIITSAYLATRPIAIKPEFLAYLLRAYDLTKVFYSMGGGLRQSMKFSDVKWLPVMLPSPAEQTAIAIFLDRETAKIDALVAEQERLIALLKEKRQAVISHAVTKGLNPNAPMKDSGIEWLGEIPAHWDVAKGSMIGRLFSTEQVSEDQVSDLGSIPFLKVASLSADGMQIQHWNWFVEATFSDDSLPSEFIVFPKRGAAIFGNKVNVVQRSALIDPNLMGWSIYEGASTFFIAFALKARGIAELADVSTVPQINNKHIAPERFPLPPRTEQAEIVLFLEQTLDGYADLVRDAQSAITLLQERRAALISAAVTGKIDVRGLVPQTPELKTA